MDMFKRILNFFNYWYVRYLLATELYIVEPWEKVVIHVLFAVLFGAVWMFNYSIVLSTISKLMAPSIDWQQIS